MGYQYGTTRRADQPRPATGLQVLHPPTIEPRPMRPETRTQCRANMRVEDYATALQQAHQVALTHYVDEPPIEARRRLAEATAEADQWVATKPPRKKK